MVPSDEGDHPSSIVGEETPNAQNQNSPSLDAAASNSNVTEGDTSLKSKSSSNKEATNIVSSFMLFGVLIQKPNPEEERETSTNATLSDKGKEIETTSNNVQSNCPSSCPFCKMCVCPFCKVLDSQGRPGTIQKKLTKSDVDQSSRLLIGKQFINILLPFLTEAQRNSAESAKGLPVQVWDVDDGNIYHLRLKFWKSSGSFVLTSSWIKQFVERRNLKVDDTINLLWDRNTSMFLFRVFERCQGEASGSKPRAGGEQN